MSVCKIKTCVDNSEKQPFCFLINVQLQTGLLKSFTGELQIISKEIRRKKNGNFSESFLKFIFRTKISHNSEEVASLRLGRREDVWGICESSKQDIMTGFWFSFFAGKRCWGSQKAVEWRVAKGNAIHLEMLKPPDSDELPWYFF